jgi:hypothetical protein
MLTGLLLAVIFVAPIVWGLVDAIRRPKEAFAASGRTKGLWIGLLVVALIAPPIIGAGIGVWYLIAVRPKVAAATPSTTPPPDER